MTSEETCWQQWSEILKNWEEVSPKNGKLVKQLVRQGGIPEHLRGMAWQLLSDSINAELKEQYPTLIIVSLGADHLLPCWQRSFVFNVLTLLPRLLHL